MEFRVVHGYASVAHDEFVPGPVPPPPTTRSTTTAASPLSLSPPLHLPPLPPPPPPPPPLARRGPQPWNLEPPGRGSVLVGTMSTSIVDAGKPGEPSSTKGADSNVSSPQPTGGGGLPLPSVSVWAKWVLGSVFWFAVPLCKRVLSTEEVVEEKVEAAAEMADRAAEVVKKVAVDVAKDLPGGGGLRRVVLEVEEVADMVIVYAKEVEDFIHKVDEIKEEVEEAIEPLIKEAEAIEQGGQQKKNTCVGRKKI